MRDNRPDIIDNNFIDSQWSKMEGLLDQKLPIPEAKSTRTPFTLCVLSSLLLVSICSTVFFAYKYKTVIPTASLVKEHTVYKTIYLPEVKESITPEINSVTTRETSTTRVKEQQSKNIFKKVKKIFKSSIAIDKASVKQKVQTVDKIAELEQIENNTFNISSKDEQLELFPNADLQIEKEKRSISYNVGFETLVSTDFDFTGLGLQSGLVIPIGTKFGFNTGLAVNYITRDEYFALPFIRTDEDPSSGNQALRNFKQVYIPLGLHYAFTKKFALNSGVKVRYTYKEEVQNQLGFGPRGISLKAPFKQEESILDNTNVGITAGFLYQVNNKFSLLLNSEWRLKSIIGTTDLRNFNRAEFDRNMVNLTTSYTF